MVIPKWLLFSLPSIVPESRLRHNVAWFGKFSAESAHAHRTLVGQISAEKWAGQPPVSVAATAAPVLENAASAHMRHPQKFLLFFSVVWRLDACAQPPCNSDWRGYGKRTTRSNRAEPPNRAQGRANWPAPPFAPFGAMPILRA